MSLDDLLVEVEAKHAALCHAKAELATALISFHNAADDRDYRYVQDEVSSALHISRRGADRILSNASELTERPLVLAALRAGEIDESKVLLIVDQVRILKEPHASIAEANLLSYAPTRTYTSIRRRAQVLIHKLDPIAVERRREEKRKGRLVEKVSLDAGMAELRHTMTAHETAMAFDHIDRIACCLPKDDRTLDQKRADVARDLLLGMDTPAPQGQTMVYLTMPSSANVVRSTSAHRKRCDQQPVGTRAHRTSSRACPIALPGTKRSRLHRTASHKTMRPHPVRAVQSHKSNTGHQPNVVTKRTKSRTPPEPPVHYHRQ